MALFGDGFERCPKCGHYEFEEKTIAVLAPSDVVPHRVVIRGEVSHVEQVVRQPIERRRIYICTQCGEELKSS